MNLFYIPGLIESEPVLNQDETLHCTKVLRKQAGDNIYITDGQGNLYEAEILAIEKKNTFLKIVDKKSDYSKRKYFLHIAIAPTKNIDRFEWFLEKATEIGIDEITPIICNNSERKIIKPERLEKIIESAMKQSVKAFKPKLNSLQKIEDFITLDAKHPNKYIANCYNSNSKYLAELTKNKSAALVLIGPEGDFTKEEVSLAVKAGYQSVSLGKSRLRTETAGVFVCSIAAVINGL
jgi:16S rRNA (uracil1498-N3)-methyltransferase